MTALDIVKDQLRLLTDYELESIIKTVSKEIDNRVARRENLKRAFFKAWQDLEDDGGSIYVCGEHINLDEDVEIC